MIQKLRRKFIWIVMAVVALILSAIFFTMLSAVHQANKRMSIGILHQALNMEVFPQEGRPPVPNGGMSPLEEGAFKMRLPVLVIEVSEDGSVSAISNQLHFIGESDMESIAESVLVRKEEVGVIRNYGLRYLRESHENMVRIALADISLEQENLRTQIVNSLSIGGLAMLVFFFLSLQLSRWAVRPVEAAWERQKQFIANASHELKTPLTVILSNAHMLQMEKDLKEEKNARRMEHIQAEALRMKLLVEDMLTLARSDSTERIGPRENIDFSYLVKSAVLKYEAVIYDEGKRLLYEIEDGLFVAGHISSLQQAVHILLDNAQKYSVSGKKIHVSLRKGEHKKLLLKVSNEGNPIPKEELEHIFLRFYRCDESRSQHGSFGLGLSIAQSIIKEHKGSIWAESDEILGNQFYVQLPLVQ